MPRTYAQSHFPLIPFAGLHNTCLDRFLQRTERWLCLGKNEMFGLHCLEMKKKKDFPVSGGNSCEGDYSQEDLIYKALKI